MSKQFYGCLVHLFNFVLGVVGMFLVAYDIHFFCTYFTDFEIPFKLAMGIAAIKSLLYFATQSNMECIVENQDVKIQEYTMGAVFVNCIIIPLAVLINLVIINWLM